VAQINIIKRNIREEICEIREICVRYSSEAGKVYTTT